LDEEQYIQIKLRRDRKRLSDAVKSLCEGSHAPTFDQYYDKKKVAMNYKLRLLNGRKLVALGELKHSKSDMNLSIRPSTRRAFHATTTYPTSFGSLKMNEEIEFVSVLKKSDSSSSLDISCSDLDKLPLPPIKVRHVQFLEV